jgi:hypothetical protein
MGFPQWQKAVRRSGINIPWRRHPAAGHNGTRVPVPPISCRACWVPRTSCEMWVGIFRKTKTKGSRLSFYTFLSRLETARYLDCSFRGSSRPHLAQSARYGAPGSVAPPGVREMQARAVSQIHKLIRDDAVFCISNSPQNRHPERSASQIYRVTQRLMARSRRTPRALVVPMPLGAFQPPKPATVSP